VTATEGVGSIDNQNVQVASYGEMLKTVVKDKDIAGKICSGPCGRCGAIGITDYRCESEEAFRQQQRFVARRAGIG
jgi:hypothetical protein